MTTIEQIIESLELLPLPEEGGLFNQTYYAPEGIDRACLPARYTTDKPLCTAIFYLLTAEDDSFSALHKLPTDEIYHFYLGDPVEMLQLLPNGTSRRIILGQDILADQKVQHVVPRGVWQGSRVLRGGRFALLGTTMAPGYTEEDYEGGDRKALISGYPDRAALITALTRS